MRELQKLPESIKRLPKTKEEWKILDIAVSELIRWKKNPHSELYKDKKMTYSTLEETLAYTLSFQDLKNYPNYKNKFQVRLDFYREKLRSVGPPFADDEYIAHWLAGKTALNFILLNSNLEAKDAKEDVTLSSARKDLATSHAAAKGLLDSCFSKAKSDDKTKLGSSSPIPFAPIASINQEFSLEPEIKQQKTLPTIDEREEKKVAYSEHTTTHLPVDFFLEINISPHLSKNYKLGFSWNEPIPEKWRIFEEVFNEASEKSLDNCPEAIKMIKKVTKDFQIMTQNLKCNPSQVASILTAFYHLIGHFYEMNSEYEMAKEHYLIAKTIIEDKKNKFPDDWIGKINLSLAFICIRLKHLSEAEKILSTINDSINREIKDFLDTQLRTAKLELFTKCQTSDDTDRVEYQVNHGDCYAEGIGCPNDIGLALYWYQIAADKGNDVAQFKLAKAFETIPTGNKGQDQKTAIEWYQKSAINGNASAQFRLGQLYEEGNIITKNLRQSHQFYQMAAAQNHAGAQKKLANPEFKKLCAKDSVTIVASDNPLMMAQPSSSVTFSTQLPTPIPNHTKQSTGIPDFQRGA